MALGLLLVLFFCSGACGLIYQVLWLRLLSLVFGVTVYAASTVLAAFMAGLALGSALAGRLVTRTKRPLLIFGVAEILVGLSALATPLALSGASAVYQRIHQINPDSLAALTAARLAVSFAVLLVPTVLMGLTLPVLSASSLVRGASFGARLSALYAVNTAGAVSGALLAGFYLIGAIGIKRSFLLGAALNVLVGVAALALHRRVESPSGGAADAPSPMPTEIGSTGIDAGSHTTIGAVVAVSGFAALALEILWFRMLLQYLAATNYAFTTMLATVLAGIALGGAVASRVLRRRRDWLAWLTVTQLLTGLAVLASAIFLGRSYRAGWLTAGDWEASAAAILPVATLMGLSLPIALRVAAAPAPGDTAGVVAQRVGRLYSLNVFGAIAGALLGGFVVLPLLGAQRGLIAMAAVYGLTAHRVGRTARPPAPDVRSRRGRDRRLRAARRARAGSVRRRVRAPLRTRHAGVLAGRRARRRRSACTRASFAGRCISTGCIRRTTRRKWSACIAPSACCRWRCIRRRPTRSWWGSAAGRPAAR